MTAEIRLHPFHPPRQRQAVDIVFVHGLSGDPERTWLGDAGPEEPAEARHWARRVCGAHDDVRVFVADYPTVRVAVYEQKLAVPQLANTLAHQLTLQGVGERPVIFVGHSMGGLVIKQMLVDAAIPAAPAERRALWTHTTAICFLGTPHNGAGMADALAPWVPNRDNSHIPELALDAPWLQPLASAFRFHLAVRQEQGNAPSMVAYRETQLMKGVLVVPLDSADPRLPGCEVVDLPCNHEDLPKPTGGHEERCLWLDRQVQRSRQGGLRCQPHPPGYVFVSFVRQAGGRDDQVHALIQWLITQGIAVRSELDHPSGTRVPAGGWDAWTLRSIQQAYTVLVIGSHAFAERFQSDQTVGSGAHFDGAFLTRSAFESLGRQQAKLMPLLMDSDPIDWLPPALRPWWNEQRYPGARQALYQGICTPTACDEDAP